jgi:hypothetical protein
MSQESAQSSAPVINVPGSAPQTDTPKASEAKPVDQFASKFAALTRKEREFAQTQKQREEEYSKKMAEIQEKQSRFAPYEGLETEIKGGNKRKALEFLMSQGLTAEELSDMLVTEMNPDPELKLKREVSGVADSLKKEIEALRAEINKKEQDSVENRRKEEEERAKLKHDEVIKGVLNNLTSFVNGNENDYTLIKQYNSVELVYETMRAHYDEQINSGMPANEAKILTYKEACDAVEGHLAEEVKRTYEAKWSKQAPKTEVKDNKLAQTLTNTLSSEVPKSGERYLSDEESKRAAAKLLRWQE